MTGKCKSKTATELKASKSLNDNQFHNTHMKSSCKKSVPSVKSTIKSKIKNALLLLSPHSVCVCVAYKMLFC